DHFEWVKLVDIPGLRVVADPDGDITYCPDFQLGDHEDDYREKLRGGHDPKKWYARKLGAEPVRPALNRALFAESPDIASPDVVFSPFATRANGTWEIHNWRILANTLMAAGYRVIALDAPGQPDRCKEIGVEYFWG